MTNDWASPSARRLTLDFDCLRSLPEGLSEVRVWRDTLLDCDRVGKRIDLTLAGSADLINEPATLQRIDHPNVVPVMAAARVSGYPPGMDVVEIVTPYYRRGSITDALLRGEVFTAQQAVSITQHILRGLGALHEQYGLCHRDVKSGNVLLPDIGETAMVADLGLAAAFDDQGQVASADNPTLYSPPELGLGLRLGRPMDLWAVGLIMRELIGGNFPYGAYPREEVIQRLSKGRSAIRQRDMALPIWVPRSLARVYKKATNLLPERRYQTAAQMDEALAGALVVNWSEQAELTWVAPFVYRPGRTIRIDAQRLRRGGYRLATLVDNGSGFRRVQGLGDVEVTDLLCSQSRGVFDQASKIASVR